MHVFGRKSTMRERENDRERERKGKRLLKVDTFLSAPDLLARHLLVRRDSAVPETPTGQGTKSALNTSNNIQNCIILCFHIQPATVTVFDILYLGLVSFCPSSDEALQRRYSYTQRSGCLQGDSPKTWRCDWSRRPLPFPVPWPPCDSSSTTCTDPAVAGWCFNHLLPLRVGG